MTGENENKQHAANPASLHRHQRRDFRFFEGTGSFITGRFSNERKIVKMVLVFLLLVALVYVVGLSPLIYHLMPNPIPTKIMYSVLLLSPLYLLMGMPFPLGLRIVSREVEKDVIWMYAVNGGGSVMGSIIGMILVP